VDCFLFFNTVTLMWRKDNGEMIASYTCENKHNFFKRSILSGFLIFPQRLELPLSTKPRSGPLPVVQLATSMWNPSTQIL